MEQEVKLHLILLHHRNKFVLVLQRSDNWTWPFFPLNTKIFGNRRFLGLVQFESWLWQANQTLIYFKGGGGGGWWLMKKNNMPSWWLIDVTVHAADQDLFTVFHPISYCSVLCCVSLITLLTKPIVIFVIISGVDPGIVDWGVHTLNISWLNIPGI